MGNDKRTVIIGKYNSEKKELHVQVGFNPENTTKNDFINEVSKVQILDENNIKLTQLNEENLKEIINTLEKLGTNLYEDFCEKISLKQFSEEINNGIEVLEELTPYKFKQENIDESVLIVDDIISAEEQLYIFKEKISENLQNCPLIENPFKSILDVLDNMATTKGINDNSLKNLAKELFGIDNLDELSLVERLGIQKMAVIDFLITNNDTYLNNFLQIREKLKNLI